ncbi:hypothetical protein RRG08_038698 [Elysia crispata]|uniref:Uncharacterized protein n=1 Tax=Elysia crispata TaxID=231223 RepID=A0AAE0ZKM4_9GAST|nr:hypothetical protein RRG08_038698 [Elysia crispata]
MFYNLNFSECLPHVSFIYGMTLPFKRSKSPPGIFLTAGLNSEAWQLIAGSLSTTATQRGKTFLPVNNRHHWFPSHSTSPYHSRYPAGVPGQGWVLQ